MTISKLISRNITEIRIGIPGEDGIIYPKYSEEKIKQTNKLPPKNTLPRKAIMKKWRRRPGFPRPTKAEGICSHQTCPIRNPKRSSLRWTKMHKSITWKYEEEGTLPNILSSQHIAWLPWWLPDGLPWRLSGKKSVCNVRDASLSRVQEDPWRRKWQLSPAFFLKNSMFEELGELQSRRIAKRRTQLSEHNYPETKVQTNTLKEKGTLQTNISGEYRCKTSQQNISNPNSTTH